MSKNKNKNNKNRSTFGHKKFMKEITSKFLATLVDPPKFRDTRDTLLLSNPLATRKRQGAFPKLEAGYKNKGDAQKARSLHLEQKRKLARGIKE